MQSTAKLLACAWLALPNVIVAAAAPADASLDTALDALRKKHFEQAAAEFKSLADDGHRQAAYYLAGLERRGLGIEKNPAAAK